MILKKEDNVKFVIELDGEMRIIGEIMGKTLINLSQRKIDKPSVFPNRFCVEICESVHVHYKNLRLIMPMRDFISFSEGVTASVARWKQRGEPSPSKELHIELCRKHIEGEESNNDIKVNLNENLYKHNEGRIFSEGSGIKDERYIHLKIRDIRLEMSVDEFKELAHAVEEAKGKLENSGIGSDLQAT